MNLRITEKDLDFAKSQNKKNEINENNLLLYAGLLIGIIVDDQFDYEEKKYQYKILFKCVDGLKNLPINILY